MDAWRRSCPRLLGWEDPNDHGFITSEHVNGRFEEFFDELGKVPAGQMNASKMTEVMAKYGMKYIGPPLFGSLYKEH